ncbi:PH domain-containing protein [Nocardiopsis exhalans]|uniref:PH domain-containing protein n=1 Tax=Nocardiopsis exhalans TaxID=163604 RepID=A0ABY5DAU9_9ACTN|nr:PH domain-containing protein [Nocardiopsis exhalans]USY21142.1 PH domain-containing protein [Nocardiopsis exhalans]
MHEAQSSSPPLSRRPLTLRSRGFAVMGGLLLLMAVGIALIGSAVLLDAATPSEGAWIVLLVAGAAGVFGYLLGFHPRLRLLEEGIELRSVLSTVFVPWARVRTLDAQGRGQLVIGLDDGQSVGHFHYGASLGGELIRYRHHRRVVRRIEDFRAQVGPGAATDREAGEETTLPVVPALCVLLVFQVPHVVAFALSPG